MPSENNAFIKTSSFSRQHNRAQFSRLNKGPERRRGDLVRGANLGATTHVITGTREIIGAGEDLFEVVFPVSFTAMPFFTSGASLAPGATLTADDYPVVSGIVAYWDVSEPDKEKFGGVGRQYFKGAQIAVTFTGQQDLRIYFSWQFTGTAIANPRAGQPVVPSTFEQGRAVG